MASEGGPLHGPVAVEDDAEATGAARIPSESDPLQEGEKRPARPKRRRRLRRLGRR